MSGSSPTNDLNAGEYYRRIVNQNEMIDEMSEKARDHLKATRGDHDILLAKKGKVSSKQYFPNYPMEF